MAIEFNINPYYDDFDETKNYHRILFRPGYAVQARELTQLQTQLQDQITKFGNHVFVNGTIVLGGQRTYENDVISIKMQSTYQGTKIDPTLYQGKTIIGETSGTEAFVKVIEQANSTEPLTFIVKITSGVAFVAGEKITTNDEDAYPALIQASAAFFNAATFSINSGIFYINGNFVYLEPTTVVIGKYTRNVTKNIGLIAVEKIITSDEDSSLLDRAQGSPNYTAPGADRYQIDLQLTVKDYTVYSGNFVIGKKYIISDVGTTDWTLIGASSSTEGVEFIATDSGTGSGQAIEVIDNFFEIARVVDGSLVVNKDKTLYSELGKELARRTFDESGDYTVRRWGIHIENHKSDTPDPDKFTVALDPGKGYIKGYEFETETQQYISVDRARDLEFVDDQNVAITYGNFLNVDNMFGAFITNALSNSYSSVELHDVAGASATTTASRLGTAKVRFLQLISGTPGQTTAVYRMYLFDIKMQTGKLFKNLESIVIRSGTTILSRANVSLLSKVGGTAGGDVYLTGQDSPGLVFPLQNQYIAGLRDELGDSQSQYTIQRTYSATASAGTFTIATLSGLERFEGTSGTLSDTIKDANYHVVIKSLNVGYGGSLTVGQVVRMNTAAGRSISLTTPVEGDPHQASFNLNDPAFSGDIVVITSINVNNQISKTKTLSNYTIKILGTGSTGGLNTTRGVTQSLNVSDIYDITGVYNTGTVNPTAVTINPTTGALNWGAVAKTTVTKQYQLDNGQRAEFYDHGGIRLIGTAPASNQYLLVVYRNFAHTGNGFLSRESYAIPYEKIPAFRDPASGITYELRDCIDFRPRRADNGTALTGGQLPDPFGTFDCSYSYYLARFDKVVATADRQFSIIKGVPAVNPVVPIDVSNGMTIYILGIPPYTANVRDIQVKYIDNKRYTMRDIGRLEKRINNLEYYTQLTMLEKQAKDSAIPDASNFEKFKNGFAVDPFTSADIFVATSTNDDSDAESGWTQRRWGWWTSWFNGQRTWNAGSINYNDNSIAYAAHPDFNAAIDPVLSELRAPFTLDYYEFNTGALSTTIRSGDLISLAYTQTTLLDQPLATGTININPFAVIRFLGQITLEPSFDQWVDTTVLPAVNRIVDVKVPDAADRTTYTTTGSGNAFRETGRTTTTQTNILSSSTTSLGTSVVDVQIIPWIRPRTILGVCKSFKPKARLYPFFEGTNVSAYCRSLTLIEVQNHVGTLFNDNQGTYETLTVRTGSSTGTQTGTLRTALYTQPKASDTTKRLLYVYGQTGTVAVGQYVVGSIGGGYGVVTAVTNYSLGSALTPDEFGNIAIEFQIPANMFATGERTLRLIDSSINDTQVQTSIGESTYTASGLLQRKQETLLTTRSVQSQKITNITGYYYRVDPIAQSFFVEQIAYPQGVHVSSIDVYFKTKSNTVPVTMELRRTVNGYPESTPTIPFASVIKKPSEVVVSTTGTAATTFTFPTPIHLTPGEYAIVLLANTQEYEVFISELGKPVVGGTAVVDKQPYIGSLFISQNASTWEPNQNKDLKFKIKRAVFSTTGSAEFNIQNPTAIQNYHTLFVNTSTIIPTGTDIVWQAKAYNADGTWSDGEWTTININQDIEYANLRRIADQTGLTGGQLGNGATPSLRLKATLSTTNTVVSPAIDVSALAAVAVSNTINNSTTGEAQIDVNAGGFVVGEEYTIKTFGTTNWATAGATTSATGVATVSIGSLNVLEVTGSVTGEFAVGQLVTGTGIPAGTTITALGTGDGAEGTYTLSANATAGTGIAVSAYSLGTPFIAAAVGSGTGSATLVAKSGGSALAKYITKPINLADGFDASNLCVTVDIYKPNGTDVKVYMKTLSADATTPIEDENWILLELEKEVPNSLTALDYKEHRYFPAGAFDQYGVPNDTGTIISPRFNAFQIKIVMLSSSAVRTPKLRDLRIIALDI